MFFYDYILEICRNELPVTGLKFCSGTMMVKFRPTTTTTLPNRTPRSTLHRVFRSSMTTLQMMTTILNLSTHHHHHRIHQMFLCKMTLTRRIPPYHLLMMILFTHHFNHHRDRMMTHQMRKCIRHKMNLQIYHHIHHHHQIIHNRFPEPMPYLLHQTRLFHQTLMIHLRHTVPKDHLMIHQYHLRQMLVFNPVSC